MPTVILLDVSLSMIKPVLNLDNTTETYSLLQLAIHGINHFLDYLTINEKLEFVSLVTFSSSCEVLVHFTRDFEHIKSRLSKIEEQDKTCLDVAFSAVGNLILAEWGSNIPCNVVLFTDGSTSGINLSNGSMPLPFPFPGKLHVVSLSHLSSPASHVFYKVVELAGTPAGSVFSVEPGPCNPKAVNTVVQKLAEAAYASYAGQMKCGHLTAKVNLYPPPEAYVKQTASETVTRTFSETIDVCGFINLSDLGSPMAVSKHLVSPVPIRKLESKVKPDVVDVEEETDEGKIPSFCVLFHGALKVENVAALCTVGEDWFGVLYSWADNKKKSNLTLTVFEPGFDVVPWLGDLRYVGAQDEYPMLSQSSSQNEQLSFPVRPTEKRSYSQNSIVWIRAAGLQGDIQKVLRHARKMPEKTTHFYKELNRIRRAAVWFGFVELLDGLADILERECLMLPSTAHIECSLQINHAVSALRRPYCRDLKYSILQLKTKFQSEND